jgi:monofunctional chorismate mutase
MEPGKEIEELRGEIDEIDKKIVRLLCRRFEVVGRIARAKRALGVAVEDAERERDVLENCIRAAGDALDEDFIEKFTALVLEQSKRIQRGLS